MAKKSKHTNDKDNEQDIQRKKSMLEWVNQFMREDGRHRATKNKRCYI